MQTASGHCDDRVCLAGAPIVLPDGAGETAQVAALELARYLYLLTGLPSPVVDHLPQQRAAVVLDPDVARTLGVDPGPDKLGGQGFAIHTGTHAQVRYAAVVAATPRGLLHGAYALLEELGVGFYLGGHTLPDGTTRADLPLGIGKTQRPVFAVRGNLLHDNLLIGTTTWGLPDYQFHFDQLARLRCNTLLTLWYCDHAPEIWDETGGRFLNDRPIMSTLTRPWRARASLRTSQFSFGTGDCFDEEVFSNPAVETIDDPIAQRQQIARVFAEATRYARRLGIDVASGFSPPVGDVNAPADPTDPEVVERFKERLRRYLARNPDLAYFVLLNHESGGCSGTAPPTGPGAAHDLLVRQRDRFAYLGNPRRVWEAIRYGRFAETAHEVLHEVAPQVRLVLSGWGGDRWMHFADYCLAYDKRLPRDVIFACSDNIDASFAPTVSAAWGELPPSRQRWAVPWVENDGSDCWSPQPHVETLGRLAPDALRKGCQGLLTMQWRTRDMEEETGFAARFAWDPSLTPKAFCDRMARDAFGPDHVQPMAENLLTLQRLGCRWTGVHGTPEVGEMIFTGWKPHAPFELGPDAVQFLLPFARGAKECLGADPSHLGVHELTEVVARLEGLASETDPDRLRQELADLEEMAFGVRPELVHRGMTPAEFSAVDSFLLRLHHLVRNVGVASHMATLGRIRTHLAGMREQLVAERHVGRLERVDFLAATLDFAVHYDRVAMLLADGEEIDRALQEARARRDAGDTDGAGVVAARAYERLVATGMRDAVLALTRKLTTRCEFGVLATVNIKPLAAYWEAVGQLASLMPAAPPRELSAGVYGNDVHVWWAPPGAAGEADGLHVYRAAPDSGRPVRLTVDPLPRDAVTFIDRPGRTGRYQYTVTAVCGPHWESPHSHPADVALGRHAPGPQIVAPQPPGMVEAGQPVTVRVAVLSRHPVTQVALHYRSGAQTRWQTLPMLRRFRCAYHARIPDSAVAPGLVKFFVEATDASGRTACWPATALQGRPWTAGVVPPAH